MAKSAMLRARIEPELKENVEVILEQLGLNVTDAITLFFKQIEQKRGLPFDVTLEPQQTQVIRERPAAYVAQSEGTMNAVARIQQVVEKSPLLDSADVETALAQSPYFTDEAWYAGAWSDVSSDDWSAFERGRSDKRQKQLDAFFDLG